MSTQIEQYVAHPFSDTRTQWEKFQTKLGVRAFYLLVLMALTAGAFFCYWQQ